MKTLGNEKVVLAQHMLAGLTRSGALPWSAPLLAGGMKKSDTSQPAK